MIPQTYLKKCPRCNKVTNQIPYLINVKRGIKLRCISCGYVNLHYINANKQKRYIVE